MGLFGKIFGSKEPAKPEIEAVAAPAAELIDGAVCSPVSGTPIPLSEVSDPLFSKEIMGKGCAVKPSKGVAYAPVTGMVTAAFPTGHAYSILSDAGIEVLVHIGLDTVGMNGKGFSTIAAQGSRVKAGYPLGTFDSAAIKAAGLDDTVIVVITNTDDYEDVELLAEGPVVAGGALLKVSK